MDRNPISKKEKMETDIAVIGGGGVGLAAAVTAAEKGAKVIAFTGRPGSELENISDITLCIDSSITSSVQEIHQLAYHIICDLVEINYFEL